MIKKGYTLSEVMVTMAILGLLASILLPSISKFRPNRDKMLFKKAYYVAERIVYELVNDDEYYPVSTGKYVGLNNTQHKAYVGGVDFGGNEETAQKSKFCGLFAQKVNTTNDEFHCDGNHDVPAGGGTYTEPSFYTSDGIAWYMPWNKFGTNSTIYVDVSGKKDPNCMADDEGCTKPDIFSIIVHPDGKMHVEGAKEIEFLQSNTTTR